MFFKDAGTISELRSIFTKFGYFERVHQKVLKKMFYVVKLEIRILRNFLSLTENEICSFSRK